jgi:anti-sigma regulatory factor (Ser/Thr protein kinase)/uncharacterized protein (DUF1330 family)
MSAMQSEYTQIQDTIMKVAESQKRFRVADVLSAHPKDVSRQYVSTVLGDYVRQEKLIREGGGGYTTYVLPKYSNFLSNIYKKRVKNSDLKEHEVFDEIQKQTPLLSNLQENVQSIFNYAFLEMLNNAIEHSQAKNIDIDIHKERGDLCFNIRDYGIGVFKNVMSKRKLNNELEAIQDLLKGKVTTQPRAHSGEGIFFTSRVSDLFILESFGYRLRIDNKLQDVFVEELPSSLRGTLVSFRLSNKSKKHLNDIFKRYQSDPNEYGFDKTEVHIKLYTIGGIYISRSQARRVLSGLEKFKTVIMDFDKVPTVGQAFADEVFRVFQTRYPNIEIRPVNMNESVKFMIDRVEKTQASFLE